MSRHSREFFFFAGWFAAAAGMVAAEPVATGRGGAVATISHPATVAGIEILDAGGNAIDAAVAAAAVLGVTDPFSCGIGGGGFMVIHLAETGRAVALDFRESAPRYVGPGHFMPDGAAMAFEDAMMSGLSVGVPGTVRGWQEALQRYGTMTLARVLEPAIRAAEEGFVVDADMHAMIAVNAEKFARFTSTRALYLRDGAALPVGTPFRNPDLAQTYRAIASGGASAFYTGEIAEAIVTAANRPPVAPGVSSAAGAHMTLADLQDYEVRFREPVRSTYRGYEIVGMPLPSSGGIAIAEALNILESFELAGRPRVEVEHLFLEASRLAFADRNAYVGDGEFVDVPVAGLLAKAFARQRARLIDARRAGEIASAGDPFAFQQDLSVPLRPSALPSPQPREGEHTTHFAVSDRHGNIVACTFTIEAFGGSGIVVPGHGFLLNNELTDFDFAGPHPNVPEARKRPRSSMSPTIVYRDGRPVFTLGSPGGATIITTVLQTIVNRIDLNLPLSEALAAPRLSQRNARTTDVEARFDFAAGPTGQALAAHGHRWNPVAEIGAASGIEFHADGSVTAVSEPVRRHGGSAMVQD